MYLTESRVDSDSRSCGSAVKSDEFSDLRCTAEKIGLTNIHEKQQPHKEKVNEWMAVIKPVDMQIDDGEVIAALLNLFRASRNEIHP